MPWTLKRKLSFFFFLWEGFFHFAPSVSSSPIPSLKKAGRGKICQFRCYPLLVSERKWKFSASETSDCKDTGGRKGCTSCNAEDHTAIKQWRNQKFSLNSSGTEKVLSFHLAQKQILPFSSEEKDHRSLHRDAGFFSSKHLQAVFWLQGAQSTNPILLTLDVTHSDYFYWLQMQTNFHQRCTSCFSADDRILLASLCLNFIVYSKGFSLCIRHSQI